MKNRLTKTAASAVAVLVLASACGGGGRPSVDELSEALQSDDNVIGTGLEAEPADCLAEAFHESDISDDTLRAIVENDEDYEGSDEDREALGDLSTESMAECMGAELPDDAS